MEYTIKGYVTRDKNGNLYIYDKLPKRNRQNGYWYTIDPYDKFHELPNDWFPEITWTSEPLLIDIIFNS